MEGRGSFLGIIWMVHGSSDESLTWGYDSGEQEMGTHLRDGSETESTESIYSYAQHMYSVCATWQPV